MARGRKPGITQAYVLARDHDEITREARRWGIPHPQMYELVIALGLPEVQRRRLALHNERDRALAEAKA